MARSRKQVSKEEEELKRVTRVWKRTSVVPVGYTAVQPDGKFGWVVLFGAFIITTVISVPTLLFGIILKDMIQYTGSTTAQASWTVSISLAVSQFIGPLATILIHLFTCRNTAFAGGILVAFGLFVSTYAKSIYVLYFTFGVITGFGMGLSRVPCFVITSHYFKAKFGVAAGIIFAGFGCGRLVFAPVCQKAIEEYGFQGTFIIMSGICLNICVGACLFQEVSRHMVLKKVEEPVKSVSGKGDTKKEVKKAVKSVDTKSENNKKDDDVWISMKDIGKNSLEEQERFLSHERRDEIDGEKMVNYMASAISVESIHQVVNIPTQNVKKPELSSPPPVGRAAQLKLMLSKSLDFSLLKTPIFYLICVSGILTYLTVLYSNVFLFPLAIDKGLTPLDASLVLTVKAGAEIAGRLGFPWIQQITPIDPILFYVIICTLVGFSLLAQALVVDFASFMTFAIVTGIITGGTVVQNTTVTLNAVGLQQYPSVVGLCSFVQSFFALLAGPLIGFVKDLTGSFVDCYLLIMGLQFIGGLLWFIRYIYVKCCARSTSK